MIRILILCLLVASATAARAEVITFRSGEHADFSRLVLTIPRGTDWRLGRDGDGYALQLGNPADRFDISSAFDRISRNRIAALDPEAGPGRLGIALACDCHATAFLWRADKLVLDVADGGPPAGSVFETPIDGTAQGLVRVDQPTLPILTGPGPQNTESLAALPDPFIQPDASETLLSATERAIAESLARAASQGLLTLDPTAVLQPSQSPPGPAEMPMVTSAEDAAVSADVPALHPGLTTHSAIDISPRSLDPDQSLSRTGQPCLAEGSLDVAAWADESDFGSQIGRLQARLTGEFDSYSASTATDLARLYIHFGFGREALRALQISDTSDPQTELLASLAHLVDAEPSDPAALEQQEGCANGVVFWLALARGSVAGLSESQKATLTSTFRALPDTLRGHLGASLAQLFLQDGDFLAADTILAIARNGLTADVFEREVAQVGLTAGLEGSDRAMTMLSTLARSDDRTTAETLGQLIDMRLAAGQDIDDPDVLLAEALLFENRGRSGYAALAPSYARALISKGQIARTLDFLEGDLAPLSQDAILALRSEATIAAAAMLPVAEFLNFAFGERPAGIDQAARDAIATRLTELGFPDEAQRVITADQAAASGGVAANEADLPRGSIAIPQANPLEPALATPAVDVADAVDGADVVKTLSAGEAALPGLATDAPPDGSIPVADAWLAGDWDRLAQTDDPLLQAASEAMRTAPALSGDAASLATSRTLLAEAEATRALAESLLNRFALDEVGTVQPIN